MAILRFQALQEVMSRQPKVVVFPSNEVSDFFGIEEFAIVLGGESKVAILDCDEKFF